MKALKLILIVLCLPVYLCCKKHEIQIVPIKTLNHTSTVNNGRRDFTNKGSYFLIRGYEDSAKAFKFIEAFVKNNIDKDYASFDNYTMVFFKESSETTIENIQSNPKIIDRYSNEHDHVYDYLWHKGKFSAKFKYKKGIMIEPKADVELGPQLPLTDSIK